MKHRLCLPDLTRHEAPETGSRITLESEQAHYLGRVLRLKPGAQVALFDGAGREWPAEISSIEGRQAELTLIGKAHIEPTPSPLILASSWLKGSSMDPVVQKAVELGATEIRLLNADRSNAKLDEKRRGRKLAHLERVARSAAEQCETNWLPPITNVDSLAALLALERAGRTLFLDLGGKPLQSESPEPLTLIIGPEGGWSDAERLLAESTQGLETVGLGPLTLRAETAPLAALASIRQSWEWQR